MTQEQKTKISEHFDELHATVSDCGFNPPNDISDALRAAYLAGADYALDIYRPRWISVKEELPKEDGKYLIYTKSGQQIIANYECHRGKWHQFNEAFFTPTHWSHLPQPPLVTDLNKKDLPPVSWQEGNILVDEKGGEE